MHPSITPPEPLRARSVGWTDVPGPMPLVIIPHRRDALLRRHWRNGVTGLATVALVASIWWSRIAPVPAFAPTVGPPPTWNLQLSSGGATSTPVLVFGDGVGIHLMRAPSAPATGGKSVTLPTRVTANEVWMISLGRAPLQVAGDSRGSGGFRPMSARGRVIKAYQLGSTTGVSSW